MLNQVTALRSDLDLNYIDDKLPFTNNSFHIRDISYKFLCYGKYELTLDCQIGKINQVLTSVTNDTRMIDNFDDGITKTKAIIQIININEYKLVELNSASRKL